MDRRQARLPEFSQRRLPPSPAAEARRRPTPGSSQLASGLLERVRLLPGLAAGAEFLFPTFAMAEDLGFFLGSQWASGRSNVGVSNAPLPRRGVP
jgi:hypothetical protein